MSHIRAWCLLLAIGASLVLASPRTRLKFSAQRAPWFKRAPGYDIHNEPLIRSDLLPEATRQLQLNWPELSLPERLWQSSPPNYPHCLPCKIIVSIAQQAVLQNKTVEAVEKLAVDFCITSKIYGGYPDVCSGMVSELGPEIMYIFSRLVLDPTKVCSLLKKCPAPASSGTAVSPVQGHDSAHDTTRDTPALPLPQLKLSRRAAKNCNDVTAEGCEHSAAMPSVDSIAHKTQDIGYIVHLSDFHLDLQYAPGSNAGCGKPLCCRAADGPAPDNASYAHRLGDYRCDLAPDMFQAVLSKLQSLPNPDMVLVTGDDVPHDVWMQSEEGNAASATFVANKLQGAFPNSLIYATAGNHEGFPVNQYRGPPYESWLWDALATAWGEDLTPSALESLKHAGFYTELVRGTNLRIVSLNTNYCAQANYWLLLNSTDMGGQLAWWEQVMAQARLNKERVYVIAHISPGGSCYEAYNTRLNAIIEQYHDIIAGLFFGHSHTDGYMVFKDAATQSTPLAVGLIPGSVTTYGGLNPTFRVYQYDRQTFQVLDWTQYTCNLSASIIADEPQWYESYTASKAYQVASISPVEMDQLAQRMNQSWPLFQEYYYHANHDDVSNIPKCHEACRQRKLCSIYANTDKRADACKHLSAFELDEAFLC